MARRKLDLAARPYDSFDSMEGVAAIERGAPPRLLRFLPQSRLIHAVYPGVLVAGTIALASTWLAQHYGAQNVVRALDIGFRPDWHFFILRKRRSALPAWPRSV